MSLSLSLSLFAAQQFVPNTRLLVNILSIIFRPVHWNTLGSSKIIKIMMQKHKGFISQ